MGNDKYWLACADTEISSILSTGYTARRRKYIPLSACMEDAITAFQHYLPTAFPALLLVQADGCMVKTRGKGFAMLTKHAPPERLKQVNIVEAALARIEALKEQHEPSQKEIDKLERRVQTCEEEKDKLQGELQAEREEKDIFEDKLNDERQNRQSIQEKYDKVLTSKRRWLSKHAQLEKKIQRTLEQVEEHLEESFSDHFEELPDDILSSAASDSGDGISISHLEVLRFEGALGREYLASPALHEENDVIDLVTRFVKKEHDTLLRVGKIWKVSNPHLEKCFAEGCSDLFVDDPAVVVKFHGTSEGNAAEILAHGFKLPIKPGVYGKGIYFASDSTKSARYMRGEFGVLLVCKVALGKVLTLQKRDKTLDQSTMKTKGYDSVYAARDSKSTGGVYNDEYIVYDGCQVLPTFVALVAKEGGVADKAKLCISKVVMDKARGAKTAMCHAMRESFGALLP